MFSKLPHRLRCVPKCSSKDCDKVASEYSLCLGKATLTTTYCHQHYAEFRLLLARQGKEFGGGRRELEDGSVRFSWTDRRRKGDARLFYASRRGFHSY